MKYFILINYYLNITIFGYKILINKFMHISKEPFLILNLKKNILVKFIFI